MRPGTPAPPLPEGTPWHMLTVRFEGIWLTKKHALLDSPQTWCEVYDSWAGMVAFSVGERWSK